MVFENFISKDSNDVSTHLPLQLLCPPTSSQLNNFLFTTVFYIVQSLFIVSHHACVYGWHTEWGNTSQISCFYKTISSFLSSHQLPADLQLGVGSFEFFTLHIGMLTGFCIMHVSFRQVFGCDFMGVLSLV